MDQTSPSHAPAQECGNEPGLVPFFPVTLSPCLPPSGACYHSTSWLCSFLMSQLTQILNSIEQGDPHAAEELLPLVYEELRKLAATKLAQEKPGQTLEATALVHEAYLRLVDADK